MAAPTAKPPAAGGARAWAPYVLTVLLIWLAWQIVIGLLVQRAPPEMAIRVAPGSPAVMSRAAEGELVAGRVDQARDLAEMALRASPFDVRALRILGLAIARSDEDAADPILTLAGNWSLRDDPSHAWLLTRRLRQGDYVGSFGHADALARRREDLRPGIFRYFATAAAEDPRAVPALLQRYAVQPNWRPDFFAFLRTVENGPPVQAALAVGLDDRAGTLSDHELEILYVDWLNAGRIPGLLALREQTGRPAPATVVDGGFDGGTSPKPFGWDLITSPGVTPTVSEDRSREGESALFLETDGFLGVNAASQLLTLSPGPGTLSYSAWVEAGGPDPRLRWTLTCLESGAQLTVAPIPATPQWRTFRVAIDVPADRCTAQWLHLETTQGPRRSSIAVWIDDVSVTPGTDR
jgi:hypothetical protein